MRSTDSSSDSRSSCCLLEGELGSTAAARYTSIEPGKDPAVACFYNSALESYSFSQLGALARIPIPSLRIAILAVGTRGDIQPFILIGKKLRQEGHRVRLASHECFREIITSSNLEFYPLGGDPVKLSEYMYVFFLYSRIDLSELILK
jgi:hypothetical protein